MCVSVKIIKATEVQNAESLKEFICGVNNSRIQCYIKIIQKLTVLAINVWLQLKAVDSLVENGP